MVNGVKAKTEVHNNNELKYLRREVALLRSIVISIIGEDPEGKYKPSFVKTILKAAEEKPKFKFKGADELIKQLGDV